MRKGSPFIALPGPNPEAESARVRARVCVLYVRKFSILSGRVHPS
jgi:hypothetical protein